MLSLCLWNELLEINKYLHSISAKRRKTPVFISKTETYNVLKHYIVFANAKTQDSVYVKQIQTGGAKNSAGIYTPGGTPCG